MLLATELANGLGIRHSGRGTARNTCILCWSAWVQDCTLLLTLRCGLCWWKQHVTPVLGPGCSRARSRRSSGIWNDWVHPWCGLTEGSSLSLLLFCILSNKYSLKKKSHRNPRNIYWWHWWDSVLNFGSCIWDDKNSYRQQKHWTSGWRARV